MEKCHKIFDPGNSSGPLIHRQVFSNMVFACGYLHVQNSPELSSVLVWQQRKAIFGILQLYSRVIEAAESKQQK